MKNYFLFSFFVFNLNLIAYSQNTKYNVPKKTNTVVLLKEGTALLILTNLAQYLQDNGYTIDKMDKDLLSLSTDFKDYNFAGKAGLKIVAYTRQVDSIVKIEIKGKIELSSPFGGQVQYEACNCGLAGDARKNAFNTLLKLLENYSFESIEFLEK